MRDSAMLKTQRRPGLAPRRRIGSLYVTILVAICIVVGLVVASRSGPLLGLFASLTMLLLPVLTSPVWFVTFSTSRIRLRRIRDQHGLDAESIAVRSTADFSTFPPSEITTIDSYTKPWTTYQLLTITERGIELRTFPRKGSSAGALLRFNHIATVDVGTADFGDLRERAILISGTERGTAYSIGLAPVDEHSLTLHPVDDEQFRDLAHQIIAELPSR